MNIAEIAKLAGVSPSAVSRYLNQGYLSQEKKEVIRRVIEETGYRPLAQAQALRTRRTRTIGVVLPKIDSFSIGSVMAGIDSVLERRGFQILLADTHNDPARELEYLDSFDDQRVDGVILIGTVFTARHIAMLKKSRVPVVIVGQQLAGMSCVYHDDYHAFYDMTRLLIDKGCRRLGYIGALPQDKAVGQERSRAYCDAARDAGLEEQAGHMTVADFSTRSGGEKRMASDHSVTIRGASGCLRPAGRADLRHRQHGGGGVAALEKPGPAGARGHPADRAGRGRPVRRDHPHDHHDPLFLRGQRRKRRRPAARAAGKPGHLRQGDQAGLRHCGERVQRLGLMR